MEKKKEKELFPTSAHEDERKPAKLVIPDIFCNSPAGQQRPVNGLASSPGSSTGVLNPEFNERRHSESVPRGARAPGQARPRSEVAASQDQLHRREGHAARPLNGNPFQDDLAPVWAAGTAVSSPEVVIPPSSVLHPP
jgi:hypothetical protein